MHPQLFLRQRRRHRRHAKLADAVRLRPCPIPSAQGPIDGTHRHLRRSWRVRHQLTRVSLHPRRIDYRPRRRPRWYIYRQRLRERHPQHSLAYPPPHPQILQEIQRCPTDTLQGPAPRAWAAPAHRLQALMPPRHRHRRRARGGRRLPCRRPLQALLRKDASRISPPRRPQRGLLLNPRQAAVGMRRMRRLPTPRP